MDMDNIKLIQFHLTVKDENGEIVQQSPQGQPEGGFMMPHPDADEVVTALFDMNKGESRTIKLDADKSPFGEFKDEMVQSFSSITVQLMTNPMAPPAMVKLSVSDDGSKIVLDANHPMAGETNAQNVQELDSGVMLMVVHPLFGPAQGKVSVKNGELEFNFNHPLAGQAVTYEVTLVEKRDPTDEEKQMITQQMAAAQQR